MAKITLHDEREYNSKQSQHDFLPRMPGTGLFLAPSGQFKTKAIVSLLLDEDKYAGVWDKLIVASPSVDIDDSWRPVKREVAKRKMDEEDVFFRDWNEGAISEQLDELRRQVQNLKDKGSKDLPTCIVVVDDFSDNPSVLHRGQLLNQIATRGRHCQVALWVSAQKFSTLSPVVRTQIRFMCLGRLRSESELKAALESISAVLPRKMMEAVYREATEQPHSFLYINLMAHDINSMFMVRFEHPIRFE